MAPYRSGAVSGLANDIRATGDNLIAADDRGVVIGDGNNARFRFGQAPDLCFSCIARRWRRIDRGRCPQGR